MKKLNQKGFTLVELLAVVVILAILIAVVAGTALPAMNNAKKGLLETYAKRVVEQAKTLYMTECIINNTSNCGIYGKTYSDIKSIMGDDADETRYKKSVFYVFSDNSIIKVSGGIKDSQGNVVYIYNNNIVEQINSTDLPQNICSFLANGLDWIDDVGCQGSFSI